MHPAAHQAALPATPQQKEPGLRRTTLLPSRNGNPVDARRCFWSATGTARSMLFPFVCRKQWFVAVQALETKPTEALQNRMQAHPLRPLVAYVDIDC